MDSTKEESKAPEEIIEAASKGLSLFLDKQKENKNIKFTTNDFQFYSYIIIRLVENLYKELHKVKNDKKDREEKDLTHFEYYEYYSIIERANFVKYAILKSIEEASKQIIPNNKDINLIYDLTIETLLIIEDAIINKNK